MHVRPMQQEEISDVARMIALAMWEDEITVYASPYRAQYPESYYQFRLLRTKTRFYSDNPVLVAVSDPSDTDWNGKEVVMGYACYQVHVDGYQKSLPNGWLGNTFERKSLQVQEYLVRTLRLDRSADSAALEHVIGSIQAAMQDTWHNSDSGKDDRIQSQQGGQHVELDLLCVHPDHRRKGIGKLLLQWGFDLCRAKEVPFRLIASTVGEHLYKSVGFREVRRVSLTRTSPEAGSGEATFKPAMTYSWALMEWP